MTFIEITRRYTPSVAPILAALIGIYLTSRFDYLLFHSLAEGFSIVIAFSIFMIAWNARRLFKNSYLLFIGIAYLFIGGIDFLHLLAYKGMGVFEGYGSNLATQLWIAGRYMEAFSLLFATFFFHRRLFPRITFLVYGLFTGLLLTSIFYWRIFPDCFIEGLGLTPFKIYSEYAICLILLAAIGLLIRNSKAFDRKVLRLLIASIAVTVAQELAFTTYLSVYGPSNMIGHLLKIISFYLIYKAISETSLVSPWNLLYRDLKQSEDELRQARDELELRVQERTSELAETNAALIESEKKFRLIAETVQDVFWMYRPGSQKLTYMSPAFERIAGRSFDSSYLDPMKIMETAHPEDQHIVLSALERRFLGEVYDIEFRIVRPDGTVRWISDRAYPVNNKQDRVEIMVGVATDITPRKKAEQQLMLYAQELERANRDLTDFSYIATHDLQEPLRLLVTLGDRLVSGCRECSNEKGPYLIERIQSLARRASASIRDIHKYSMISSSEESFRQIDLNMVVREALAGFKKQIEQKEAVIEIENLPSLEADATQMGDVFRSLLGNALKFTGNKKPRISVSGEAVDDGKQYRILVKDNGIGFDEVYLDKIFTPFQRLQNRDRFEGSGIGLALCRKVLERHGGSITAKSSPRRGSTFIVTLPVKQGAY